MTALDNLLSNATRHLPLLQSQSDTLSPFTTPQNAPVPPPAPQAPTGAPPPLPAPVSLPQAPSPAPPSPFSQPSPMPGLPGISPIGQGSTNPFQAAMAPILAGGAGGSGNPATDVTNAVHARQHQLSGGNPTVPSGGPTTNISYASLPGKYGPLVDPHGGPSDLRLQKGALQSLKTAGVSPSVILGGSYRTYAQQAANYASDSSRFAPPGQSLHEYGLAIDVNSADIAKVQGALLSNGWYRERSDEPWHFSFGVYTKPPATSQYTHKTNQPQTQTRSAPKQQPHQAPTTGTSQQPKVQRQRVVSGKTPNLRGI